MLLFVAWSYKSSLSLPTSLCLINALYSVFAAGLQWRPKSTFESALALVLRGVTQLEVECLKGYETIIRLGTTALDVNLFSKLNKIHWYIHESFLPLHGHTHSCTKAHTHTQTHARTHKRTHAHSVSFYLKSFLLSATSGPVGHQKGLQKGREDLWGDWPGLQSGKYYMYHIHCGRQTAELALTVPHVASLPSNLPIHWWGERTERTTMSVCLSFCLPACLPVPLSDREKERKTERANQSAC